MASIRRTGPQVARSARGARATSRATATQVFARRGRHRVTEPEVIDDPQASRVEEPAQIAQLLDNYSTMVMSWAQTEQTNNWLCVADKMEQIGR